VLRQALLGLNYGRDRVELNTAHRVLEAAIESQQILHKLLALPIGIYCGGSNQQKTDKKKEDCSGTVAVEDGGGGRDEQVEDQVEQLAFLPLSFRHQLNLNRI